MKLPQPLEQAIEAAAAPIAAPILAKAAAELGRDYACGSPARFASAQSRIAYIVTRMPAIFEVNRSILSELARLRPEIEIRSVLDLGCGPGTAMLAAQEIFGPLQIATMVDSDPGWTQARAPLIAAAVPQLAAVSRSITADLRRSDGFDRHDLVILSYALGEIDPASANRLVERAWACARHAMVIVEPGTPRGFHTIVAARQRLIDARAGIVAPCTHSRQCPLAAAPDWCHFDKLVERTRRHQRAKAGTLPFEMEKFSYVIAAAGAANNSEAARIIKHPMKKGGHVILDLCTADASIRRIIISRRDQESYRQARATRWGDIWPVPDPDAP
jgi:ribosomal protein RSM22 (predicted rRNA methylase)